MTNQLFHSAEFMGVTMNRYGTVIDKGGRFADLNLIGWIQNEARKSGWCQVRSENRDEGMIWVKKDN